VLRHMHAAQKGGSGKRSSSAAAPSAGKPALMPPYLPAMLALTELRTIATVSLRRLGDC
jgi:hypothetical protein